MEPWTGRPVRLSEVSRTQPWVDMDALGWGPQTGRRVESTATDNNGQPTSCPAAVHQGAATSSQHSRKRAFAEYGIDSDIQQTVIPEELSTSLGGLQFNSEPNPNPDLSRGRPVSLTLQNRHAGAPRFLGPINHEPPAPPPDIWQGVDELLADSRNLRLLDVAEASPAESPVKQLQHAPSAKEPQPPQKNHYQHNPHFQRATMQPQPQTQQQLQQQYQQHPHRGRTAPGGALHFTQAVQHPYQQQQQPQAQHHRHNPNQHQHQQHQHQQHQHAMSGTPMSTPPLSAPAGRRPQPGSATEVAFWSTPPPTSHHRQLQQPQHHPDTSQQQQQHLQPRILASISAEVPQPSGSTGGFSGPNVRALEISHFSTSCRIHSPCSSQHGLPQLPLLAGPPSGGTIAPCSMAFNGGGGVGGSLCSCGSERILGAHEGVSRPGGGTPAQPAAAAAGGGGGPASAPYGAINVPGWGVPQDLEVHMDLPQSQLQETAVAVGGAPYRVLASVIQRQPAALQPASQQVRPWLQQTGAAQSDSSGTSYGTPGIGSGSGRGTAAAATSQALSGSVPVVAAGEVGPMSGSFRVSGGIPSSYGESSASLPTAGVAAAAAAALVEDVSYGMTARVGDGRGGFGVAVAPTKLLRRSSATVMDVAASGGAHLYVSRTGSGVLSQALSPSSGSFMRMNQEVFASHQPHPQQQQPQQQQQQAPHKQVLTQQHGQVQQQQQQYSQQYHHYQEQQQSFPQQQQQQQQQPFKQQQQYGLEGMPSQGQPQMTPQQQPQPQSGQMDRHIYAMKPKPSPNKHAIQPIGPNSWPALPHAASLPLHAQQQQQQQEADVVPITGVATSHITAQDLRHLQFAPMDQSPGPAPPPQPAGTQPQLSSQVQPPQPRSLQEPCPDPQQPLLSCRSRPQMGGTHAQAGQSQSLQRAPGGSQRANEGGGGFTAIALGGGAPTLPPPPDLDPGSAVPAAGAGHVSSGAGWGLLNDVASEGRQEPQASDSTGGSAPPDDSDAVQLTARPSQLPFLGSSRIFRSASLTLGSASGGGAGGGFAAAATSAAATAAAAAPLPPASKASQRAAAAAAAREAAGATKAGRPRQRTRTCSTLADVIRLNLITAGPHRLLVGNQDTVDVMMHADGRIECGFGEFRSVSSLALAVLRQRNPSRLACDGWQEVKLNGVRLDELRQEAVRLLAREGGAAAAGGGANAKVE